MPKRYAICATDKEGRYAGFVKGTNQKEITHKIERMGYKPLKDKRGKTHLVPINWNEVNKNGKRAYKDIHTRTNK